MSFLNGQKDKFEKNEFLQRSGEKIKLSDEELYTAKKEMNELMKKNLALEKEIRDQQDTTKKVLKTINISFI